MVQPFNKANLRHWHFWSDVITAKVKMQIWTRKRIKNGKWVNYTDMRTCKTLLLPLLVKSSQYVSSSVSGTVWLSCLPLSLSGSQPSEKMRGCHSFCSMKYLCHRCSVAPTSFTIGIPLINQVNYHWRLIISFLHRLICLSFTWKFAEVTLLWLAGTYCGLNVLLLPKLGSIN